MQKVPGWENAVNSFRVDFDCDIYITCSNAYLLSSELSTYLSGRYVEIMVLPLSFREFLDFHGYTLTERKSPAGGVKKRIMDVDGEVYDARELYDAYTRFGGMPMLADIGLEINRVTAVLDGVYSAAVINDILEREKRKGQRTITDAVLLRKIIMFFGRQHRQQHLRYLYWEHAGQRGVAGRWKAKNEAGGADDPGIYQGSDRSLFFYEIKRFDIKGKSICARWESITL